MTDLMVLWVNGERREVARAMTAAELIASLGVFPELVAIELNRGVVPRGEWGDCALRDGDRIEIVSFIGGG